MGQSQTLTPGLPQKKAGAVLAAHTIVKMDTAANEVCNATDATAPILGVVRNAPAENAAADIAYTGTALVKASTTISKGATVTATTGGKAVTTTTAGNFVLGVALEAAGADGDLIEVLLTPGVRYAGA